MVKKWLESKKRKTEFEYDETKREFEMAMGKPFITIKVEIPTGFEKRRSQFLSLEKDEQFHEEVEDLVKKRLILEKRRRKSKI
jgi:hypothetical protein